MTALVVQSSPSVLQGCQYSETVSDPISLETQGAAVRNEVPRYASSLFGATLRLKSLGWEAMSCTLRCAPAPISQLGSVDRVAAPH